MTEHGEVAVAHKKMKNHTSWYIAAPAKEEKNNILRYILRQTDAHHYTDDAKAVVYAGWGLVFYYNYFRKGGEKRSIRLKNGKEVSFTLPNSGCGVLILTGGRGRFWWVGVDGEVHFVKIIVIYSYFTGKQVCSIANIRKNMLTLDMETNKMTLEYIIDKKIDLNQEDLLGTKVYADTIESIIIENLNKPESLSIGIFGEWGSGKSSILSTLESKFIKNEGIKYIEYDAWKHSEDSFKRSFLEYLVKDALKLTPTHNFNRLYDTTSVKF